MNGEDLEEEIDVISDEMASLRTLAADLKVTLTPPRPAPSAPPPNSTGAFKSTADGASAISATTNVGIARATSATGGAVASVNALTDATPAALGRA